MVRAGKHLLRRGQDLIVDGVDAIRYGGRGRGGGRVAGDVLARGERHRSTDTSQGEQGGGDDGD
jgi:hypothetical protein